MIYLIAIALLAFFLEITIQRFWIDAMRKMKLEQVTKLYGPKWHEENKLGTPEMGGVVFVAVAVIVAIILCVSGFWSFTEVLLCVTYPIAAAAVGFADDLLKHLRRSSDGFTSMQKLFLQIAVTVPCVSYAAVPPYIILPYVEVSYPVYVAAVSFIGVGLLNAVNVTDGLDGLAVGCSLFSFVGALFVLCENADAMIIAAMGCGVSLGFLWHNSHPASVFMGDVGSHFLAALILTVCLTSGSVPAVFPLGFMFGIEIFTVFIQIVAIRHFHRKIFKMSPVHHHFELCGWKETKIVARFWLIHIVGMLSLLLIFTLI
ncbi:MAG: phospho-N-acetylmuramoyl-pentapeptide-transferase [Synergistes sp.]|nr:phospho-N-acetylmuramoyl-pentapeptide-transferase [Synergistes sp.]